MKYEKMRPILKFGTSIENNYEYIQVIIYFDKI